MAGRRQHKHPATPEPEPVELGAEVVEVVGLEPQVEDLEALRREVRNLKAALLELMWGVHFKGITLNTASIQEVLNR